MIKRFTVRQDEEDYNREAADVALAAAFDAWYDAEHPEVLGVSISPRMDAPTCDLVVVYRPFQAAPARSFDSHAGVGRLVATLVGEPVYGVRPLLPEPAYGQDVALVAHLIDDLRRRLAAQVAKDAGNG